ncbi:MAG: hypothetical protein IIX64_01990, partial [Bacteroidales bacterium]|nr:hypothetical protein [Bacteroidales bacterium]
MVSCARIDDTVSSSQNDQPQIEDTENSTDEDGELVDPYPHVELTDTLRIECQGDNNEEEKKESAETEGGDDTKTYLNAQNYIYWKKGDRIKIYYADGGTNYTVSEIKHGDQQTSTFDALVDKKASYYYAFYPENIEAVMTDIAGNGAFEVVIPTTQDGKFENCHLAIGKSSAEDRNFSFKNIASYMKIVVDDLTATSLTLSARDENNAIVGTLVAPFADEAGNLGSLTLKNGTGSSSVTVNLAANRKAPCTIYVALLPGVNFSQGFRLRYNYDAQTGPGFAYTSNRSIERKKILNVGTLSNRIHTDWFVKTDGTISDPSQGGNSWDNALNTAGLVALLNQPTIDGVQDNALAYDKACVLDGATIHIAKGNYTLSNLKLSATGYDNLVKVRILGSYPTGLTGTNTSATRDVVNNRTAFAGNGSSRILLVEDKVDLALDKLWFTGGRSAEGKTHEGGTALRAQSTAIEQASNLSLSHCGFEDNVASGLNADGGAVYLSRATAYMENCEFKNNSCGEGQIGGAINIYDDDYHATLTLKSCQFSGNKAGLSGGAVSCSKGRLYISGTEQSPTVFEENSVTTSGRTTRGGALLLAYASSIEVEYTNFIGNYGISTGNYGTEGGAVAFAETSYGSFEHVSFVGTKGAKNAVRNGAHVSMDNTSSPAQATTFKNCSFTKGQASNVAGAIHIREYSKLSLEDCSFANNTTSNFGGALHINNKNAQASFTDCTFSENSTKVYGGALSMEDGTCNFYNCSFTGNVGQYGAISLYFQKNVTVGTANLNIYGCTFQNNSSTLDDNAATLDVQKSGGGAIYAGRGNVFVTSSDGTASGTRTSFTGNSAESGGGAISLIPNNGTVSAEIKYADINQNTASEYGGAIYANTNLSMTDCILDENTATLGASALYVSGNLTVTGSDTTKCAIRNHSESVSGSIIRYSTASALSFSHCKISKNTLSDMTENGGYFPLKGSNSLSMTNCEFSRNTLPASADTKYGGFAALYEGSTASLALTGTKVADCSGCKHGGAIYVKGGKSSDYAVNISGGSFENCSCDAYGGVINFDTPTDVAIKAQVIGTSFTGNSAGYKGGVFHLNGNGNARELLLESCTFSNNTHTGEHTSTGGGGGVINMAGGKLTINSCTFT